MSKFAPITSSLLARKGEAGPWQTDRKMPLAWEANGFKSEQRLEPRFERRMERVPAPAPSAAPAPQPLAPMPQVAADPERMRSCTLKISQRDYERIGIVAVKRGSRPQLLMREAIDAFLVSAAHEYRAECSCLASGGCNQGCS